MAPVKALSSERFQDWRPSLGLKCKEHTGDTDEYDLSSLSTYHLILTTPEKWDSLTRKWKVNKGIVQIVKLFLINEVHLLNEEQRGPMLEAVVSRMKTVRGAICVTQRQTQEQHHSDSQTTVQNHKYMFLRLVENNYVNCYSMSLCIIQNLKTGKSYFLDKIKYNTSHVIESVSDKDVLSLPFLLSGMFNL
ncbi:probable ATP-dependent DNA helicase HFM1 isoform X2 [Zootermopsis nevadensis]|nr:probable ATP-dependent DNA helicase HFM1 isoform X2 [Zootermopsis nevadensis]